MDVTVRCRKCQVYKESNEFFKSSRPGRTRQIEYICKPCKRAYQRDLIKKPRVREGRAEYHREYSIKQYGLNIQQYNSMLEQQDNCCDICIKPFTSTPHVDHDHRTGKVRGLLCANCNHAIGKLGDDPLILRRAADYLENKFSYS